MVNDKYDSDYVFDFKKGFNVAVAFTSYDGTREPELDGSYGEIVFNHFKWGPTEEGGYITDRIRLPSHPCTQEELGIAEG